MFRSVPLFLLTVIAATNMCLMAQVQVGDKAPVVAAEKLGNTKLKSLKDLKGRLVLYEYFAHW